MCFSHAAIAVAVSRLVVLGLLRCAYPAMISAAPAASEILRIGHVRLRQRVQVFLVASACRIRDDCGLLSASSSRRTGKAGYRALPAGPRPRTQGAASASTSGRWPVCALRAEPAAIRRARGPGTSNGARSQKQTKKHSFTARREVSRLPEPRCITGSVAGGDFSSWRCSAWIQRTVPVTERITTVSVSITSLAELHAAAACEPSVTPVAANRQSPRTMSSMLVDLVRIGDAHLQRALALLLGVEDRGGPASGRRCSAAPPPPARLPARRRCRDRCRCRSSPDRCVWITPATSPSVIRRDRGAGLADRRDQVGMARPVAGSAR